MPESVVGEWLDPVDRDLQGAVNCISADEPTPEHGAFFVQQAAEKLVKAALIAEGRRPLHTHDIDSLCKALRDESLKSAFAKLARFSKYAIVFRYPGEERDAVPSVPEIVGWIAEIIALKVDFGRWLEQRASGRSSSPQGDSAEGGD